MQEYHEPDPVRARAFEDLLAWYPLGEITFALPSDFTGAKDYAFYKQIVNQVIRYRRRYDYLIEEMAEKKLKKLDREVIIALYIGLAQLDQMDRTETYAAVSESVNLVGENIGVKGFVNALLRRFLREREFLMEDMSEKPEVFYSFPGWMFKSWKEQFGEEAGLQILESSNYLPEVSIAIRPDRVEETLQELEEKGYKLSQFEKLPNGFEVSNPEGLFKLSVFHEGNFLVQDSSSQRLSHIVAALAGEKNIDVCSAPGGKLFHAEWFSGEGTKWIAADLHPGRMERLENNKSRLRSKAETMVMDILEPTVEAENFDLVTLDAPCSATGTIRKHPEIKWKRGPQDVIENADLQKKMIFKAAELVKPGGMLVYSTCSLQKEENEEVVAQLLAQGGFVREAPKGDCILPGSVTENGDYFCLPDTDATGLFASFLRKCN